MNLSPCLPKTPVRTPQTGTSSKSLQLTPIWEAVVKSHRIPPDVNENSVFQEISSRLGDLEWPVRQHAFRVLYDIIPIISKDRLDERIIQNDILNKLVVNLGHPAPGVRKVAMETIRQYLKQTQYSEKMLESFVLYGVKEGDVADSEHVGIIRENVILGTIMSLVDILKPFISPENGGYAISQPFLNKIVAILSEKMRSPLYQEKCAETLWKIKDMVGESRFLRSLEHLTDKTIVDLIHLRERHDNLGSNKPRTNAIYADTQDSDQSYDMELENSVTTYHNYKMIGKDNNANVTEWLMEGRVKSYKTLEESTEEYSDGTDTDTYTKETANDRLEIDTRPLSQVQTDKTQSKIPVEKEVVPVRGKEKTPSIAKPQEESKTEENLKASDESMPASKPSSPRVVLETEIQFSQDKAIKMTIVEDEKDSAVKENEIDLFPAETNSSRESSAERRFVTEDGDLIMKILHNNETEEYQEEERKRTPRRVRFGGEVIKLRTPDSDETDATVEASEVDAQLKEETNRPATARGKQENCSKPDIKVTPPKNESPKFDKLIVHDNKIPNPSHIPLPIYPATKSPRSKESSPSKFKDNSKTGNLSKSKEGNENKGESSDDVAEELDETMNTWKWFEFGLINDQTMSDLNNQVDVLKKFKNPSKIIESVVTGACFRLVIATFTRMEHAKTYHIRLGSVKMDTREQEDWKIQYRALEDLKLTLINPKVIEKIAKSGDDVKLASLFKFLLYKLPQSNNQQVTALSISVVFQLIQTLDKDAVKRNLQDIVKGLCRYVGGCKNINLKIESVQSLKMLFSLLEPSSVIDILLEHCLMSSSSKMRENSLLAIMYATMTFPSNLFNTEKILEKVARASADSRRRVRHAALEAISILSQFCSSETLTASIARVAETLPSNIAKNGLISAVQARISRRVLPSVSNEGLVLYSLQIPASRRFGNVANPSGADVDWILSGTGSISTGSARSRGQLNAAQRLDLSPTKWHNNGQVLPSQNKLGDNNVTKKAENENPWKKQKHRTELSGTRRTTQENWKNHGNRIYRSPSSGNLSPRNTESKRFNSSENLTEGKSPVTRIYPVEIDVMDREGALRPEEMSWALVPVSTLEEQQLVRIRNNQYWGDYGIETGNQYISSPLGTLRPLYLKVQHTPEYLSLSRSSDDVRRSSFSYGSHRGTERPNKDDFTHIRVLTPSVFREKNRNDGAGTEANSLTARITRSEPENENLSWIPPLQMSSSTRNSYKQPKINNDHSGNDRKLLDENHGKLNATAVQNGLPETPPKSGAIFPSIRSHSNGTTNGYVPQQKPSHTHYNEIDENKVQETMTQLDGLLVASKAYNKQMLTNRNGDTQAFASDKNRLIENEVILPIRSSSNKKNNEFTVSNGSTNGQVKYYDFKSNQLPQNTVASAPPLVNGNDRNQTPSTSSSNSTEFGVLNGSGIRLQRLKNGSLNGSNGQQLKGKRAPISKSSKVTHNESSFPDNLKPFDRPKEGLETCFSQLESQQWEVVMLGLTSLVRLLRHHPAIVLSQIHPLIMALGRQIRNLRSQVSRAACQAAAEMFVLLKRNIEIDLEELAGPLFHRSADTNRFIRLDCGQALDNMTDNVSPARAINVIISKGSTHQNAVVRTVAARLLLRLSEKIGAEKILSLPRETRDKVVQTGANLLMEGKLETRAYAKELFRIWSSHPSFSNLMLEAIPPNVMRHISKTLISLKT